MNAALIRLVWRRAKGCCVRINDPFRVEFRDELMAEGLFHWE